MAYTPIGYSIRGVCYGYTDADWRILMAVSNTARQHDETAPRGTSLLPSDLTPAQLKAAPVLASVDSLVIDELTDEEYGAFLAAVRS